MKIETNLSNLKSCDIVIFSPIQAIFSNLKKKKKSKGVEFSIAVK